LFSPQTARKLAVALALQWKEDKMHCKEVFVEEYCFVTD
jgi:hypothetical protein